MSTCLCKNSFCTLTQAKPKGWLFPEGGKEGSPHLPRSQLPPVQHTLNQTHSLPRRPTAKVPVVGKMSCCKKQSGNAKAHYVWTVELPV
ncbi:hypothetical protein CgunFtcFv8_003333 [Champsocephalus gunnari]|uniref:Uncharacterized protein n=1 Tax=Champsocephalus gunnari TaxID=52237 RepID=A0AAN8D960_CHAGU|nr:hypothetical protein CgunFtcFv8_003333 [Champsocephalus gunnari]